MYYLIKLTEQNGNNQYNHNGTFIANPKEESIQVIAEAIACEFLTGSLAERSDYCWEDDDRCVMVTSYQEIKQSTYDLLADLGVAYDITPSDEAINKAKEEI